MEWFIYHRVSNPVKIFWFSFFKMYSSYFCWVVWCYLFVIWFGCLLLAFWLKASCGLICPLFYLFLLTLSGVFSLNSVGKQYWWKHVTLWLLCWNQMLHFHLKIDAAIEVPLAPDLKYCRAQTQKSFLWGNK